MIPDISDDELREQVRQGELASYMLAMRETLKKVTNPFDRPALNMGSLPKLREFSTDREMLMVFGEKGSLCGSGREVALAILEGNYRQRADFPSPPNAYYEGPHPDDPSQWCIAIYGRK